MPRPLEPTSETPSGADNPSATEPLEHCEWRLEVEDFLRRLCVCDAALESHARARRLDLADRQRLRAEVRARTGLPDTAHWDDVAERACRMRALIDDLIARDYLPQRPATGWRMPAEVKPKAKAPRRVRVASLAAAIGVATA